MRFGENEVEFSRNLRFGDKGVLNLNEEAPGEIVNVSLLLTNVSNDMESSSSFKESDERDRVPGFSRDMVFFRTRNTPRILSLFSYFFLSNIKETIYYDINIRFLVSQGIKKSKDLKKRHHSNSLVKVIMTVRMIAVYPHDVYITYVCYVYVCMNRIQ